MATASPSAASARRCTDERAGLLLRLQLAVRVRRCPPRRRRPSGAPALAADRARIPAHLLPARAVVLRCPAARADDARVPAARRGAWPAAGVAGGLAAGELL